MIDYGKELLKVLDTQRGTYIRLGNGGKLISNYGFYNACEDESCRLQGLIGRENLRGVMGRGGLGSLREVKVFLKEALRFHKADKHG